jgi:transcriptional regulator with GAF, ATPase, and Fis domain
MLDGLLNTLTDVLDIREVFDRVSEVVQRVLPHDVLGVMEISENGDSFRLLATAGLSQRQTFEAQVPAPDLLTKPWNITILDDVQNNSVFRNGPAAKAGMQSVLTVPISFGGRLRAAVNFFSRDKIHFTESDIPIAQRIASYLTFAMSHHRLAEEAKQRQELEAQAARLDLLDRSLAALTDTGDLKETIDHISGLTRELIPHDGFALAVLLPDGIHARRFATSGWDSSPFPEIMELPPHSHDRVATEEYELIEDLSAFSDPTNKLVASMGFRAVLRIPIFIEGTWAGGIALLSRNSPGFHVRDVPAAKRIAARLAIRMEREHGTEAAKRAQEANERAAQLELRVRQLTEELDIRTGYRRVIGESLVWREVLNHAAQVASAETTVLLLGESGTGKEVVARFIHRASARKDGPFVALNCAALPEHLLESELFGYERGAFTGAMQSKPGLIEQAAGGVLFLDEVGEMALQAQAKFLRVLQEREYQRLGGTKALKANVRVVAATNRDLRKAIEQKLFREDLFFRLNVFELRLPPLRERLQDILPLSEAFLLEIGRSIGRPPAGISREAKRALSEYHWPGNVRELRNILERAAILADGGLIVAEHLAFVPRPPAPALPSIVISPASDADKPTEGTATSRADLSSMEREMIESALRNFRFNKSLAAKSLGMTRAQLYTRMKRHGLD